MCRKYLMTELREIKDFLPQIKYSRSRYYTQAGVWLDLDRLQSVGESDALSTIYLVQIHYVGDEGYDMKVM